jgi:external thioesterase TEII
MFKSTTLIKVLNYKTNKPILICFPFAGGYSSSFIELSNYLKEDFTVLAIEPPGHGTNRMELIDNLDNLVNIYYEALLPYLKDPFILFGHSMGGLVSYLLAVKMKQGNVKAKKIIISACFPPNIRISAKSNLNDKDFSEYLHSIGGIPDLIFKNKELMTFFLPAFRADFRALETFKSLHDEFVETPIYIFNGKEDLEIYKEEKEWEKWGNIEGYRHFDADHMFINTEAIKVSEQIKKLVKF